MSQVKRSLKRDKVFSRFKKVRKCNANHPAPRQTKALATSAKKLITWPKLTEVLLKMKMLLAVVVIAGVIFYFFTSMNNQKAAQENIRLGNEFLAQNKTKEDVVTTASGLQYKVLNQGSGTVHPKASDTVTVHYHGTLIDGTVFDSSVERGEPIAFPLNRVIPGWTEGVQLMVEGDKYRFFIPSELAYGNRSTGKIGGGSVLIFDVELLKIN